MSVPCPVCGVGLASSEQGKCSACAAAAVEEWLRRRAESRRRDVTPSPEPPIARWEQRH